MALSVMLVSVFLLSTYMYDTISQGTAEGVLAVFAKNAREFVYENEAVSAFLGIDNVESEEDRTTIGVASEAAAYIERYNELYQDTE